MRASEQRRSLGRWLWAAAFVATLPFLRTVQVYLENAAPDMFSAVLKRLHGKTTGLVERVMRTINLRINVG